MQSRFQVLDAYVDEQGFASFRVTAEPVKEKFRGLMSDLSNYDLLPVIRREANGLNVKIVARPQVRPARRSINLILFLATLASILFASYALTYLAPYAPHPRVAELIFSEINPNLQVLLLTVSIIGIIGLHELGHKIAAWIHRLDSTLPYFIPGPPPFGTFGAVISLRSPPANRDQLFDLGFSGPFLGFIATILVAILSFLIAPIVSQRELAILLREGLVSIQTWPRTPLLLLLLDYLNLRPVAAGSSLILTQIAFAAQVGALITFLNILPIWQLDGGHITRALLGAGGHKFATFVGFVVLFLAGYWVFGLFLLLMMAGNRRALVGVEPLDDISQLSASRKAVFGLAAIMAVLCFMIFA